MMNDDIQYLTFKEIIGLFQKFTDESFFIKSFNYGEETEVTRNKNLDYPRMFLYYPLIEYINSEQRYSFVVNFLDRTNENITVNRTNILTKLIQLAEALVMRFEEKTELIYEEDNNMKFEIVPIEEEKGDDRCYGVTLHFSIRQQWDWSLCQLPFEDDDILNTGKEPNYTEDEIDEEDFDD